MGDLAPPVARRGGGGGGGGRRTLGVAGDKVSVLAEGIRSSGDGKGETGDADVGDEGRVTDSMADNRLTGRSDSRTSQDSRVSRLRDRSFPFENSFRPSGLSLRDEDGSDDAFVFRDVVLLKNDVLRYGIELVDGEAGLWDSNRNGDSDRWRARFADGAFSVSSSSESRRARVRGLTLRSCSG